MNEAEPHRDVAHSLFSKQRVHIVPILALHSFILLFTAILLDGGVLFTLCQIPIAAYWTSVIVLYVRRLGRLRPGDVAWINQSWIVILPIGMLIAMLANQLMLHW